MQKRKVSCTFKREKLCTVEIQERIYLLEGQFPAGSMGPKIEAALNYLDRGGKRVIITSPESIPDALHGLAGTLLTSSREVAELSCAG